jgi:hypothetical protein
MNPDLESTRSALIAMRVIHGADTPIGHRCSTAGEQTTNYPGATPLQRRNLQKLMVQSHDDLSRMARQRE